MTHGTRRRPAARAAVHGRNPPEPDGFRREPDRRGPSPESPGAATAVAAGLNHHHPFGADRNDGGSRRPASRIVVVPEDLGARSRGRTGGGKRQGNDAAEASAVRAHTLTELLGQERRRPVTGPYRPPPGLHAPRRPFERRTPGATAEGSVAPGAAPGTGTPAAAGRATAGRPGPAGPTVPGPAPGRVRRARCPASAPIRVNRRPLARVSRQPYHGHPRQPASPPPARPAGPALSRRPAVASWDPAAVRRRREGRDGS